MHSPPVLLVCAVPCELRPGACGRAVLCCRCVRFLSPVACSALLCSARRCCCCCCDWTAAGGATRKEHTQKTEREEEGEWRHASEGCPVRLRSPSGRPLLAVSRPSHAASDSAGCCPWPPPANGATQEREQERERQEGGEGQAQRSRLCVHLHRRDQGSKRPSRRRRRDGRTGGGAVERCARRQPL
jgi:hypothetical protein